MRISFIGSGRVATHLAKVLVKQHQIVQIYSRNIIHAEKLAQSVSAQSIQKLQELNSHIDLLVIAVSDQSISQVIQAITADLDHVLIVHTSGSTNLNVLTEHHAKSGVFYPLQTFSLEREIDWESTPLFIETVDATDLAILTELANSLSNRVCQYSSAQRLSLHLAAVFACNFSNYCYDMAKQVVDAQQVDFSLLHPLMLETANKATQNEPKDMQTGPAMRGDQNIINMHLAMLENSQQIDLKETYQTMSTQIQKRQIK